MLSFMITNMIIFTGTHYFVSGFELMTDVTSFQSKEFPFVSCKANMPLTNYLYF